MVRFLGSVRVQVPRWGMVDFDRVELGSVDFGFSWVLVSVLGLNLYVSRVDFGYGFGCELILRWFRPTKGKPTTDSHVGDTVMKSQ